MPGSRAHDYRLLLRAKGWKPTPAYDKLRTVKARGDREVTSKGLHVHRGEET